MFSSCVNRQNNKMFSFGGKEILVPLFNMPRSNYFQMCRFAYFYTVTQVNSSIKTGQKAFELIRDPILSNSIPRNIIV